MILFTGGAVCIANNFVLDWLAQSDEPLVNLDKLTTSPYASQRI
jgi:dTDP-glucose 4,6-dehydratase